MERTCAAVEFIIDLKQDPRRSYFWAVRAMKDVMIYPWHLTIKRRRQSNDRI